MASSSEELALLDEAAHVRVVEFWRIVFQCISASVLCSYELFFFLCYVNLLDEKKRGSTLNSLEKDGKKMEKNQWFVCQQDASLLPVLAKAIWSDDNEKVLRATTSIWKLLLPGKLRKTQKMLPLIFTNLFLPSSLCKIAETGFLFHQRTRHSSWLLIWG